MTFGRRKDGRFYPKGGRGGPAMTQDVFRQIAGKKGAYSPPSTRTATRKERARLSSLQNPMLYKNFKERLERLNPDADIEAMIDREQEPEEMLMEIKRKHPEIDIGLKPKGQELEFREFLDEFGITNERVQNLVAMQDNPLSEEELAQLSILLNDRPRKSIETDRALKAPVTTNLRRWIKHPDRTDLKGVDTPGSSTKKRQGAPFS